MLYDIATVFWRDWLVLKRRFTAFILSRMVAPLLYLVAFGWGLGRSMNLSGGGSYLDFIVPGILALNSMNISFNSVATPLSMSRLYHKTLEEYLLAPMRPIAFVVGKMLSSVVRGILSSFIILALAWVCGAQLQLGLLFWAVLTLNCLVFSSLGFVAAMVMESHEDMSHFSTYVLLPMSFLCGTFFRTDSLPEAVRYVLELLPLTHSSQLLRSYGAGGSGEGIAWLVLIVYWLFFMGLSVVTLRRLRKA